MLESVSLDLVYIATPPSTHREITKLVIEKGIHVLCEKPLANSIHEAKEMKDLAEQANVVHALHFGQNYLPALNKFHEMIMDGYIGDIKQINVNMDYSSWPPEYQQNDWIQPAVEDFYSSKESILFKPFNESLEESLLFTVKSIILLQTNQRLK